MDEDPVSHRKLNSWATLGEAMEAHFYTQPLSRIVSDKLVKLQQGPDLMDEFVRKFHKLNVNLHSHRREDELFDEFIRETSSIHVWLAVRAAGPMTLEEAVKMVLDVKSDLRSDGSFGQSRRTETCIKHRQQDQQQQQRQQHRHQESSRRSSKMVRHKESDIDGHQPNDPSDESGKTKTCE